MKNRNILSLVFVVVLGFSCIMFFLEIYNYTKDLEYEIQQRDKTIIELTLMDSIFKEHTKEYSKIIDNYIYDCEFKFENEIISTNELWSMYNDLIDENNSLIDSINACYKNEAILKDSLWTQNKILELIKKNYGINYRVTSEGNSRYFIKTPSTADTAILVFPYFREKVSFDSISKKLIITDKIIREYVPVQQSPKRRFGRR
jgi:hypothetical protein